jgi:hypothetical protein
MFKTTVLTLLIGAVTAATIVPSNALNIAAPNYPKKTISSNDDECAYQLNYMPRVTRAHIESIQDRHVYLIPVCEDGLLGRNDDYGWLFTSGNVGTLRQPIARNATLMNALAAQGYDHQDVVSLRFGGDGSVALYVHQRTLR